MAKKEARAREAIDKIQKARRKQAVGQLTAKDLQNLKGLQWPKGSSREMEKTGGGYDKSSNFRCTSSRSPRATIKTLERRKCYRHGW